MTELDKYIDMIVENVFSDLVVRYGLISGDVSPMQSIKIDEFKQVLKEFVEQNEVEK